MNLTPNSSVGSLSSTSSDKQIITETHRNDKITLTWVTCSYLPTINNVIKELGDFISKSSYLVSLYEQNDVNNGLTRYTINLIPDITIKRTSLNINKSLNDDLNYISQKINRISYCPLSLSMLAPYCDFKDGLKINGLTTIINSYLRQRISLDIQTVKTVIMSIDIPNNTRKESSTQELATISFYPLTRNDNLVYLSACEVCEITGQFPISSFWGQQLLSDDPLISYAIILLEKSYISTLEFLI